ncbi:MAG: hypothetical protein MJZ29_02820 [Bacteroidaceae bacterium]|nr:hypothetical protein [Bacteroidaceae bacterium]
MAQLHYDKDGKYLGRSLSEEERIREHQWHANNWKFELVAAIVIFGGMGGGILLLSWLLS